MSVEKTELEIDLKADLEAGTNDEDKKPELDIVPDWTPEEAAEAELMGWIPEERAGKLPEGKRFIGAKEFMERNPLYSKVKQLESGLTQLNSHYQKVAKIEHDKAEKEFEAKLASLEADKIKALDNAEHAEVVKIDKELRALEKPVEEAKEEDQAFVAWKGKNEWYDNDKFLTVQADIIGERYFANGLRGVELFETVKDHLKQAHPEKFTNKERDKPSAVESGSQRSVTTSKTTSTKDLTQDEQKIYKSFKDMGVFAEKGSEQKYLDEVIALRD